MDYLTEDTDDWLGNPTPLETCRHQLLMYENEFEALTLKLQRALENIQGLVQDNDALRHERDSLRAKLQCAEGDLMSERRRFADVEHNRTISSMKTSACTEIRGRGTNRNLFAQVARKKFVTMTLTTDPRLTTSIRGHSNARTTF